MNKNKIAITIPIPNITSESNSQPLQPHPPKQCADRGIQQYNVQRTTQWDTIWMELQLNILFYTLSEGHGHKPTTIAQLILKRWSPLDMQKENKNCLLLMRVCVIHYIDRKSEVPIYNRPRTTPTKKLTICHLFGCYVRWFFKYLALGW